MKKLFLFLAVCCCATVSAQQVAVKTNLLYWATTTPNLGVEMALSRHSTLSLSANYNPWTIGEDGKIQHWFVQPEYRYWFTEKYTRGFIGVHILGGKYEVGGFELPFNIKRFADHYYKGWAVAVGVNYGWQFYISPHWNLEATLGVGVVRTRYYRTDAPRTKVTRTIPVPTEIGLSFVYLFNSKK